MDWSRRWLTPQPAACQDFPAAIRKDTRRKLLHCGDLLNHPPTVKPGRFAPVVRFLRGALRVLLRPWLEMQTRCNTHLIEAIEGLHLASYSRFAALDKQLEERCRVLYDLLMKTDPQDYPNASEPPPATCSDDVLNRELGSNGKLAQAGLWFNPPVVVRFENSKPVAVGVSERILEHMFIHTRLPKPPARVLDLGCAESTSALEMACFGYDVVGVDLRNLPLEHPALQVMRADISRLPFDDASFDVVVSLSTIEHVGLDWYGSAPQKGTDFDVAVEVKRLLRPGGHFILTVPFGRPAVTPLQRIYDRARLDELLQPFERVEIAYGVRDGGAWSFTTDAARAENVDSKDCVSAVAMIVVRKD